MIRVVRAGAVGVPLRWVIAFQRSTESRWIRWLACGRYKHVCAFAYFAAVEHWVFFDWRLGTLDIIVARGPDADRLLDYYTRDADLLGMEPRKVISGLRLGFWCVPAVKHLVGIRGSALRPDALWRDCIRQGAEVLSHENTRPAGHHARSDAGCAAEAG